jgi:hypothetical protein
MSCRPVGPRPATTAAGSLTRMGYVLSARWASSDGDIRGLVDADGLRPVGPSGLVRRSWLGTAMRGGLEVRAVPVRAHGFLGAKAASAAPVGSGAETHRTPRGPLPPQSKRGLVPQFGCRRGVGGTPISFPAPGEAARGTRGMKDQSTRTGTRARTPKFWPPVLPAGSWASQLGRKNIVF